MHQIDNLLNNGSKLSLINSTLTQIKEKITHKNISLFFLIFSLTIFSALYFSFFPGNYTNDSYIMYSAVLGISNLTDGIAPFFSLFWKVANNYNFGPFIINYLLLVTSLVLFYQKMKTTLLPQLILLGFILLPPFFITFTFAWKDNALLVTLLLIVALLLQERPKKLSFIILPLFLLAFSLRLNAFFAVIPILWHYCDSMVEKKYHKMILLIFTVTSIFFANQWITYHVLNAAHISVRHYTFATDILKINHILNEKIEIPSTFLVDTSPQNVSTVFKHYDSYRSDNYLFYKLSPEYNPILKVEGIDNQDSINVLQKLWVNKVSNHFRIYVLNRFLQWFQAITHQNYINTIPFKWLESNSSEGIQKLFFTEYHNHFMMKVRDFYHDHHSLVRLLKLPSFIFALPLSCLILNIIFIPIVLYKKNLTYRKLILSLLVSGIFYIFGYFPILPAGDYRYFIWTIMSSWIAIGLVIHGLTNVKKCLPLRI